VRRFTVPFPRVPQVVIQEGVMLLKQCCKDVVSADEVNSNSGSISNKEAAMRFTEAVLNTKPLTRPKYISISSSKPSQLADEQC